MSGERGPTWDELDALVARIEALQHEKVVALARRLLPNLTLEDLRNPHDFPDLDDPDWQYEDGVLTGVQTVASALRAIRHERREARARDDADRDRARDDERDRERDRDREGGAT